MKSLYGITLVVLASSSFTLFFIPNAFAFHHQKMVQLNNEITQNALEIDWYLNETEAILKKNNSDISEALSLLHMAHVKLGFLKNWYSNSTVAMILSELNKDSKTKEITITSNLPPIPTSQLSHSSIIVPPTTTTTETTTTNSFSSLPGANSTNTNNTAKLPVLPSSQSSKLPALPLSTKTISKNQTSLNHLNMQEDNKIIPSKNINLTKSNQTAKTFDDSNLRKAFPELDEIIGQNSTDKI